MQKQLSTQGKCLFGISIFCNENSKQVIIKLKTLLPLKQTKEKMQEIE